MEVKSIQAKDTYNIRNKILRPKGSLTDCIFSGDEEEGTFHLGCFIEKRLVSIASFYHNQNQDVHDQLETQFQLRGMATLGDFRGKGLSKALLKTAIPLLKNNQAEILWCNAREGAVGFYKSVGFKPVGGIFEIAGVGPHQVMVLELKNARI